MYRCTQFVISGQSNTSYFWNVKNQIDDHLFKYVEIITLCLARPPPPPVGGAEFSFANKRMYGEKKSFLKIDLWYFKICKTPNIRNRKGGGGVKQHPSFQSFIQGNVESNAKFTWKLCWLVMWPMGQDRVLQNNLY